MDLGFIEHVMDKNRRFEDDYFFYRFTSPQVALNFQPSYHSEKQNMERPAGGRRRVLKRTPWQQSLWWLEHVPLMFFSSVMGTLGVSLPDRNDELPFDQRSTLFLS